MQRSHMMFIYPEHKIPLSARFLKNWALSLVYILFILAGNMA